jgi:hypothetical protein
VSARPGDGAPISWRWLAAGALLALAVILWATTIGTLTLGPGPWAGPDFQAYLRAAHLIATGEGPYHHLVVEIAHARATGQRFTTNEYIYPPLLATVLAALIAVGVSDHALWLLWIALDIVATLWTGYELNCTLRLSRDWPTTLIFAAALALTTLALFDLSLGQADILMTALAVGANALWLRGSRWAPLALGLGVAIKPTLAILALVWVWKRDWRAALMSGAIAVALVLGPFIFAGGLASLRDYWTFLNAWNALQGNGACKNQSVFGAALRLFTVNPCAAPLAVAPWLVWPVRAGLALAAVAIWLRVVPRARAANMSRGMIEALLAVPVLLIISPLAEDIYYLMVAPLLLALVWLAASQRRLRRADGALAFLTLLTLFTPHLQKVIYTNYPLSLPDTAPAWLSVAIAQTRAEALVALAWLALVAGALALRRGAHTSVQEQAGEQSSTLAQEGVVTHVHR